MNPPIRIPSEAEQAAARAKHEEEIAEIRARISEGMKRGAPKAERVAAYHEAVAKEDALLVEQAEAAGMHPSHLRALRAEAEESAEVARLARKIANSFHGMAENWK